jgi:hypothetical protein
MYFALEWNAFLLGRALELPWPIARPERFTWRNNI